MEDKKSNESRCIICGQERNGLEVKEDFVINGIRMFKRYITRNEKGYRLVVCRDCYPKYKKERDRMVRRQITYVAIGIVLAALLVIVARGRPSSILYGVLVVLFLYLISLINYIPSLKMPNAGQPIQGAPKVQKQEKRSGAANKNV